MPRPLTLKQMNGTFNQVHGTAGLHSPHVLIAQTQLQAVWSGEYDVVDTITVLRREGQRLIALADSIEINLM